MNMKDEFNIRVEFEIDEDSLGFKRRITFSDTFEKLPDLIKANLLGDLEQEVDSMFMETLNVLQKKFFRTMGMGKGRLSKTDSKELIKDIESDLWNSDGTFKLQAKED
jgi:hypothetical protein|tara:strand:- start:1065 stop:1388 length:324 start_codon:yes stop_codon:yes gene_type:complete